MAQSVLIIGAGIIGASLAFHLSRAGAQVTVLTAAQPANAATGRSFGWINASFYANPAHHHLRVAGIAAHHRLAALLPAAAYHWQGTLWFEDEGVGFDALQADLTSLGYPNQQLSAAQIAAMEPGLAQGPTRALHLPTEGAIDAAALTHSLLAASGARLCTGLAAKSLIETDGQIRGARTAIGPFKADHTILAAGIATPDLLATLGLHLPMLTRPGQLIRTKPVPFRLNHILVTPHHEIRQTAEGHLLAPTSANHQSADAAPAPAEIEATLHHLRAMFDFPHVTLDHATIGHRPVPGDSLPVVGQALPGLTLAVMHSGVTLAAIMAEALTRETLGQGADPMLAEFRPDRILRKA